MHHYRAANGTTFNFSSDMSGQVRIEGAAIIAGGTVAINGADLVYFVDWFRREYLSCDVDGCEERSHYREDEKCRLHSAVSALLEMTPEERAATFETVRGLTGG